MWMSKPPASLNKPRQHPSGNFGERRDGLTPSLIVIHYTAMANADVALERLCSPDHEVSAHYLISRTGEVVQLVAEEARAWHAGAGMWRGLEDINSRSIGIELDNDGFSPFSEPLMAALVELVAGIRARWDIPPVGVIGHSDFAPDRKFDPGARFDWRRLAREGQAVWPGPADEETQVSEEAFLEGARRFGYPVEAGLEVVLSAFRLRFRPWGQGALSRADMTALAGLAVDEP